MLLIWALCASGALLIALFDLLRTRCALRAAHHDASYGVLTRSGGEAAWQRVRKPVEIVFFDLDQLHQLNTTLGYAEVDRRIHAAIQLRRSDIASMRWYSGDEIVVIVPVGDGIAVAERLQESLHAHGLSATFGVITTTTRQLTHEVNRASALVQAAKAAGQRGRIHCG